MGLTGVASVSVAVRSYDGRGIRVLWRAERCIHSEHCARNLPAVFDAERRPWIDATAAEAEEIARVVEMCPTGALRYERLGEGAEEAAEVPTRVVPSTDGPLHVRGRLRVETPDGELLAQETRVAICRCGATGNPPFCDNSHRRVGFAPGPSDVRPGAGANGETAPEVTTIVAADPGPLKIRGDLRLETPGGELLATAHALVLCRCGRSGSKPLCDGSHKEVR